MEKNKIHLDTLIKMRDNIKIFDRPVLNMEWQKINLKKGWYYLNNKINALKNNEIEKDLSLKEFNEKLNVLKKIAVAFKTINLPPFMFITEEEKKIYEQTKIFFEEEVIRTRKLKILKAGKTSTKIGFYIRDLLRPLRYTFEEIEQIYNIEKEVEQAFLLDQAKKLKLTSQNTQENK